MADLHSFALDIWRGFMFPLFKAHNKVFTQTTNQKFDVHTL